MASVSQWVRGVCAPAGEGAEFELQFQSALSQEQGQSPVILDSKVGALLPSQCSTFYFVRENLLPV